YFLERPKIDRDFFFIALPYALFVFPGGPLLGWYIGTMLWHALEDRYHVTKERDELSDEHR
ncbi:hypothetical protein, partial [Stieleria mannarensis]|uniref:hypothetical protein n=1 Tax=Stieleria mannarensis TaxID=2755585 RepID=UPI001C71F340